MKNNEKNTPSYGNWVSDKIINKTIIALLFTVIVCALLYVLPKNAGGFIIALRVVMITFSIIFLAALIYFLIAKQILSYSGGRVQQRVLDELIDVVQWDGRGKALDIGCGSGALTISLAKKYRDADITGLDYWGREWDYCRSQCIKNAEIEKVNSNLQFVQGSASELPFENESFDLVISNMTFHEVSDSKDKLVPIGEALRVLKKDGVFVFQDLFKLKAYFGEKEDLLKAIKDLGVSQVEYIDTSEKQFVPTLLKLPFMLGTAAIVYGIK